MENLKINTGFKARNQKKITEKQKNKYRFYYKKQTVNTTFYKKYSNLNFLVYNIQRSACHSRWKKNTKIPLLYFGVVLHHNIHNQKTINYMRRMEQRALRPALHLWTFFVHSFSSCRLHKHTTYEHVGNKMRLDNTNYDNLQSCYITLLMNLLFGHRHKPRSYDVKTE